MSENELHNIELFESKLLKSLFGARTTQPMLAYKFLPSFSRGVGGTVASEPALRSAGTLLSRVRAPPPAPWPDGGPESLRSPCCGQATYKNQIPHSAIRFHFSIICTEKKQKRDK
ncbi:hypothetical protein PoB_005317800 [Plakobranchus ocellatus]|uniref:Uncharacterized protein n=1 Tax=Plakobranchus ocellatus TaxID=259542 RepID=A0AAV4C5H5_9GAST|nr:hypothetical protein PoB_005317800 [Plakobranchus ocellatus]